MSLPPSLLYYRDLALFSLRWLFWITPLALVVGSACALFLWLLDQATLTRRGTPWLLFLLPLAGMAIVEIYRRWGRGTEGGNNLILQAIQTRDAGGDPSHVPLRMAPLILITTVVTHLFGGSAGREGTAVQIGGSVAAASGRWLNLSASEMRIYLMVGMAAGFAGVFGTPLAGAVFAMEVLALGRIRYDGLLPCLLGALIADAACAAWGIPHTHYTIKAASLPPVGSLLQGILLLKVIVAAIFFGLASRLFATLSHAIQRGFQRWISRPLFRPLIGGLVVVALALLFGLSDYLGLGVSSPDPNAVTIVSSFSPGGATPWSWWWKLLLTAITLGCGFKGGEVTPLFFIGAALGNLLGGILHAPIDLFAGLGFLAVFAGATHTPLACTLMGIELFGSPYALYFGLACVIAYLTSGHSGIYTAQIIDTPKIPSEL